MPEFGYDISYHEVIVAHLASAVLHLDRCHAQIEAANSYSRLGSELEWQLEQIEAQARALQVSLERVKGHINASANAQK